jgi:hypothetical protein
VKIADRHLRPEMLPAPEPNEVVPVFLEELEVSVVIIYLRRVGALLAGAQAIVKIVVEVRSGQVDDRAVRLTIRSDREVARIDA